MKTDMIEIKIIFSSAVAGIAALATYLQVPKEPLVILAVLLLIDYVTGIIKAITLNESITSNKMKYGVISKIVVILVPLVLALATKALSTDANALLLWALNALVVSEVYSILGNIGCIKTGKELPEIDIISIIALKVRTLFLSWAEK